MPRIPVFDKDQVAQAPARPDYQQLDHRDGTPALERGIGELAQGVGNLQAVNEERARKAKDRADAIAADDLFTQAQQYTTEQLHGRDETPAAKAGAAGADTLTDADILSVGEKSHVPGYLDTRGTEAHAKSSELLEALTKKYESLLKAAGNDRQRDIVRNRLNTLRESVRAQVAEHESQQFRVADQAATVGLTKTTINSAANLYDRPDDVRKLTEDTLASIKRSSLPEEFEGKKQEFLSQVSQSMIGGFLRNGDVAGAEARYKLDEKTLGDDAERVKAHIDQAKKGLEQGAVDVAGEAAAARAIGVGMQSKTGWLDYDKAAAEIEKLPAGTPQEVKVKDEARQRFERQAAIHKRQKSEAVERTFDRALESYRAAGSLTAVAPADKAWLKNHDNDPDAWERLRRIAQADVDHARGLPPTPAQEAEMTRFLVDVHDHPDRFATMSVEQFQSTWAPRLARSDRDRAGAVLAQMHDQAAKPGELTPMEGRMLLQQGREAGIFPDKQNDVSKWDDDEQAQLYYRAQKELTEAASDYRRSNGKPPPPELVQQWTSELLLKGKDPKRGFLGFGGNTTRLEAITKDTGFNPSFGDAEKASAAEALKKAGARVDDATVDAYLRRKHKLPAAPVKAAPAPAPDEEVVPLPPAASPDTPDIPTTQD